MKTHFLPLPFSAINNELARLYGSVGITFDTLFSEIGKGEGENYGICKMHRDEAEMSSLPRFFDGKNHKDVLWNDKAKYTIFCLENDAIAVVGGISHEITLFFTSIRLSSFSESDIPDILTSCAAKVGVFPKKAAFGALNVFAPYIQKVFKNEDYAMYCASITFNITTTRRICV